MAKGGPHLRPGMFLSTAQRIKHAVRGVAGITSSFLWSGSWSFLRRPWLHYLLWIPLMLAGVHGFVLAVRRRQVRLAFWAIPVLLVGGLLSGLLQNVQRAIMFAGVGAGTPGYNLFVVWPAIGLLFSFCLINKDSDKARMGTLLSFLGVLFFELWGLWLMLLLYAGILVRTGSVRTGVGFVWPTLANLALALDRVGELSFVVPGLALYLVAVVLRVLLVTRALRLSAPSSDRSSPGVTV